MIQNKLINMFRYKLVNLLPVILISFFIIIAAIFIDYTNYNNYQTNLRYSVHSQLSVIRVRLEGVINSNASSVKGLVASISAEPDMSQDTYTKLAAPLFTEKSVLRNIAAAPDLVIRYMYPVEGNEKAVGLNYRETPRQFEAVKRAINEERMIIAGPVNLVQGGVGFIARIPVKQTNGQLWGVISTVMDAEKLYSAASLDTLSDQYNVAIRGKDAAGAQGDIFYGKPEVFENNPVLQSIVLPYGTWQIAAVPVSGWHEISSEIKTFRFVLVVIVLSLIVVVYYLFRIHYKKRESETLLRGLYELAPLGIALNDYETGAFIDINDAAFKPSGYSREEFINLSYWDLTPRKYEKDEMKQLESMEETGFYGPFEKEYIRKDGSRYPVRLQGMVVYDTNGNKLIWSIIEDITERKKNEKIKNEFISMVSHELRTPLTSITGSLDLMLGEVYGRNSDEVQNILKVARNNARRLSLLINDLLDLDKLEAQKMKFNLEKCMLEEEVREAINNNSAYSEKFNVSLNLTIMEKNIYVLADRERLQQVMANLISNAAKFSSEGGQVNIILSTSGRNGRVEVIDSGTGIPNEFRSRIFQKFSQADSSDKRQKGGTGLGLAISRNIIEQMNGEIGFNSVEGKGATFYFELPLT